MMPVSAAVRRPHRRTFNAAGTAMPIRCYNFRAIINTVSTLRDYSLIPYKASKDRNLRTIRGARGHQHTMRNFIRCHGINE